MRRNCIICQEKIYRAKTPTKYKTRRGKATLTCSKECAKIYVRVRSHLITLLNKKKKWKE